MHIDFNALAYLAGQYKTENRMSLLKNAGKGDPAEGEKLLKAEGWFSGDSLRPDGEALLEVLAAPERSGRVAIREGNVLIEKLGYKKGESYVLAEHTESGFEVSRSESLQPVLMALSQVTGMSRVVAYDLELELSSEDALIYLGLVDLYRKTAMLGLWSVPVPDVNVEALAAHLAAPVAGSLVAMVKDRRDFEVTLKPADLKARLVSGLGAASEATSGLVKMLDSGDLRLAGDHGKFAMEFLVPRAVTTLEVFNQVGDKLAGSEAMVVSAGLNEHLLIKFGGGQCALSLISGSYLLKLIENVLKAPALEV
ncbi:hypothetical protein [Acidaminobacter hydrogenoformans]|uniref:Uncharacterized protein n=1 Tax=Acidaminobacter hydrogenoformans DSM 2784 TaxID=1120920 RepID=A0A1G5RXY5_9FIRM|nr:hypothetical protein [Acidaminobacter hydrogenoformans]SCZ78610.1 hypothetical protein SAMN03080599_01344 [Acidaminobacter hydrogenoformans DSM 2784]